MGLVADEVAGVNAAFQRGFMEHHNILVQYGLLLGICDRKVCFLKTAQDEFYDFAQHGE